MTLTSVHRLIGALLLIQIAALVSTMIGVDHVPVVARALSAQQALNGSRWAGVAFFFILWQFVSICAAIPMLCDRTDWRVLCAAAAAFMVMIFLSQRGMQDLPPVWTWPLSINRQVLALKYCFIVQPALLLLGIAMPVRGERGAS